MAQNPRDFGTHAFTTDAFPDGRGSEFLREVFGRTMLRIDLEPFEDQPFHSSGVLKLSPEISFGAISTTACRSERTLDLVREGPDEIALLAVVEGRAVVSQGGREAHVNAGEAVFVRHGETGHISYPERTRTINFALPERALGPMLSSLDSAWLAVVGGQSAALGLAMRYADMLLADADGGAFSAGTSHAVASHFRDLAAMMIGDTREEDAPDMSGVQAARFGAIKADIASRLGQAGLSLSEVAARHGITPRYVARLFEHNGTSFSRFVLEQRLARARRMLADPRFAHHSISTIAIDAGFGDISYFNRNFRARYGLAPSDVRKEAKGPARR